MLYRSWSAQRQTVEGIPVLAFLGSSPPPEFFVMVVLVVTTQALVAALAPQAGVSNAAEGHSIS